MPAILLLAIVILVERITHKQLLELVTPILRKVWSAVEWVFLFLLRMNEPPGSKT